MSGLQIGKAIRTILSGLDNVYPVVADLGTTFPFIIYRRTGLTPACTKDRYSYRELATVEVMVAAANYPDSINTAELVKNTMENRRGKFGEFNVGDTRLINADEDFIEDAFVQRLTFEIEII